jgi:hypothetical protein
MNGGPSHIDTFDPKPGMASGGPFRAIRTRAPGVEICEHMPKLADRADRFALVRSMTSREGNHERARHLVRTGYAPSATLLYPSIGSWVGEELARRELELPAFVSLGGPSWARVSSAWSTVIRHRNPENRPPTSSYRAGRRKRLGRQALLSDLETRFAEETGDRKVNGRRSVYANAVRMMHSNRLSAFDPSSEPERVRAHGDTDFGRGCLVARRLVRPAFLSSSRSTAGHKDNFSERRGSGHTRAAAA